MILFLKTSQAYSGGFKYGILAKLIDDRGTVLGTTRGGGYNLEYVLFAKWAKARYANLIDFEQHQIPDGGCLRDVQDVLGYHGVTLKEVESPVKNLFVYEVLD